MTHKRTPADELTRAVARLKAGILALVFGVMAGGGIFVMTIWLVIKGGPHVGAHLQLLGQYFIGYSVSWMGAFIGLAYGLFVGALLGWSIGMIYNLIVGIRHR